MQLFHTEPSDRSDEPIRTAWRATARRFHQARCVEPHLAHDDDRGGCGLDWLTALGGAVRGFGNVGPGLAPMIGAGGHFASLPDGAKWILAWAMLRGRLELFMVLVLLTPGFLRG
jgi:hypothetical protein